MIVFLSFGFVTLFCYTSFSSKGSSTVRGLYKAEGIHPVFTAIFLSISAFSNTGLSPLDDNMVPFAASPLVLVPLAALILAGNCMFPPTLRFIIWGLSVLKRTDDPQRNVYKYLLQFPRRCYTHLFPQVQTTWLMATVVAFNVVDMIAFCSLEWNSVAMTEDLSDSSPGIKLMDGIFQSLNTRSAGMNILQLSTLSPPLLVPVFLSRQQSRLPRTDVNLHQYCNTCVSGKIAPTDAANDKMSVQFRKLFTKDSASLFVHIFLICTLEIGSINSDPLNYTIFSIVFEVIRFVLKLPATELSVYHSRMVISPLQSN
ncbi:hypothetical protein M758_8G016300 [Ceratodon purpureus]|nr:hypothetical protein M758_8G016300 [Ceratodon purpureus]